MTVGVAQRTRSVAAPRYLTAAVTDVAAINAFVDAVHAAVIDETADRRARDAEIDALLATPLVPGPPATAATAHATAAAAGNPAAPVAPGTAAPPAAAAAAAHPIAAGAGAMPAPGAAAAAAGATIAQAPAAAVNMAGSFMVLRQAMVRAATAKLDDVEKLGALLSKHRKAREAAARQLQRDYDMNMADPGPRRSAAAAAAKQLIMSCVESMAHAVMEASLLKMRRNERAAAGLLRTKINKRMQDVNGIIKNMKTKIAAVASICSDDHNVTQAARIIAGTADAELTPMKLCDIQVGLLPGDPASTTAVKSAAVTHVARCRHVVRGLRQIVTDIDVYMASVASLIEQSRAFLAAMVVDAPPLPPPAAHAAALDNGALPITDVGIGAMDVQNAAEPAVDGAAMPDWLLPAIQPPAAVQAGADGPPAVASVDITLRGVCAVVHEAPNTPARMCAKLAEHCHGAPHLHGWQHGLRMLLAARINELAGMHDTALKRRPEIVQLFEQTRSAITLQLPALAPIILHEVEDAPVCQRTPYMVATPVVPAVWTGAAGDAEGDSEGTSDDDGDYDSDSDSGSGSDDEYDTDSDADSSDDSDGDSSGSDSSGGGSSDRDSEDDGDSGDKGDGDSNDDGDSYAYAMGGVSDGGSESGWSAFDAGDD